MQFWSPCCFGERKLPMSHSEQHAMLFKLSFVTPMYFMPLCACARVWHLCKNSGLLSQLKDTRIRLVSRLLNLDDCVFSCAMKLPLVQCVTRQPGWDPATPSAGKAPVGNGRIDEQRDRTMCHTCAAALCCPPTLLESFLLNNYRSN